VPKRRDRRDTRNIGPGLAEMVRLESLSRWHDLDGAILDHVLMVSARNLQTVRRTSISSSVGRNG